MTDHACEVLHHRYGHAPGQAGLSDANRCIGPFALGSVFVEPGRARWSPGLGMLDTGMALLSGRGPLPVEEL